jgi:hypothetical protein
MHPRDRQIVSAFRRQAPAALAGRQERRIIDLASFDDRDALVEERRQRTQDPRLRLAAEAEEDDVVLGENGVVQRRDDGTVVAVNAGKDLVPAGDFRL